MVRNAETEGLSLARGDIVFTTTGIVYLTTAFAALIDCLVTGHTVKTWRKMGDLTLVGTRGFRYIGDAATNNECQTDLRY